ncbi:MAG: LPS assembly lipoprotein LptE [Spongiibacteraceae bacterium]
MTMRALLTLALRSALLGSSILLAGCGFHLRETAAVPSSLQPLYIGGPAAGGALAQAMKLQLSSVDTAVSPTIMGARYELRLLSETLDQRDASIDRRGLVAEYLLIASAQFALYDQTGALVLGPAQVDERRSIFNDPDKATTTGEEIRLVRADMSKVLASRIALRLTAYANQLTPASASTPAAAP